MLLKLWNYLFGYVMIEVTGFSVERFMNMATHRGIRLWDVSRNFDAATMKVSLKDFKLLKPFARKTKCKIKIKSKLGAPFVSFRYRKRKILAFGVLFFVGILYFMSSFVWLVEVEGNERLNKIDIITYLKENGLGIGSSKFGMNVRTLEKSMLVAFSDISWVNIEIKGTRAKVRLTEIIPKQAMIDKTTPANIVAKKDGLIISMVTSAGTPKVKIGDVVSAGDILVSGELTIGTPEEVLRKEYVHATSEIKAKMYYKMEFFVPLEYAQRDFSGKVKKDRSIILFNNHLALFKPKIPYNQYEVVTRSNRLNFSKDYPLPFVFVTDEYREVVTNKKTRTEEEAMRYANELISSRIITEFDVETDIMDRKAEFVREENYIKVKALITTIELINETAAINPEEINSPEDENTYNTAD